MTFSWIGEGDPRLAAVRELFEEYQRGLGVDLGFQGFQAELARLPGKYGPPGGALLLVEEEGRPAACGALWPLSDAVCELKRIYVRPEWRGQSLGRAISEALMERARALGYATVRLDTLRRLAPALTLYRSLGFEEVAPYNFNPEPDIVYLERPL